MPTYPAIKTYRSGFYNNQRTDGVDDRVYTAEDVRKPYDTIFTDGIKPDHDGTAGTTLEVTAAGNMAVSVAAGHAKLGGAWFENTGVYTITLDASSSYDRYDAIILHNNDNDEVRDSSILVRSLTNIPTVNDLIRDDKIYELCIAYVKVPAFATSITAADIIDTRLDGALCNVMSGVGSVVVRTYRNTYTTRTQNQKTIPIGIPQYNRDKDTLTVLVEGRVFTEGANYTIDSNEQITLVLGLPLVGTTVQFEVQKNVNAAGAETVVAEVSELRNEMTAANRVLKNHYYCNGQTDNVLISQIVNGFLSGYSDYDSMHLFIHGTFGATSPAGGLGTSENQYYWFRAALGSASNRRITLDFTDCSQITINCTADTYNIIFFGMDTRVIGASVVATGGAAIYGFSLAGAASIHAENCRFWLSAESGCEVARSGTFKNCRATITNATGHSYCFAPISASLLRLFGGEYYAYTGSSDHVSAVVGLTSGENAVAIMYAVNVPTNARNGYNQTHSVYQTTGMVCCTDLISALPLNVVSGKSNIRGTIALSKAGLM